jgi:uncharacterized protein
MTFGVLALSGGGYLGLFSVRVLSLVEEMLGRSIARSFDLICGTSAGAITALALSLEVPAQDIERAYVAHGPKIFARDGSAFRELRRTSVLLRSLLRPKYSVDPLRDAITSIIPPQSTLADAKHRLVLPVVNMTTGQIEIFKTPHSTEARYHARHLMVDAAIAASAAPTYFPMADVQNSLYIDGAIFASAPDMIGVHEAEHYLHHPSSAIEVVSIGTTTGSFSLPHRNGRNYGAVRWLKGSRLFSTIMSAQQQLTHALLKHHLGERYHRIDVARAPGLELDLAFDGATVAGTKTLFGLAEHAFHEAVKSQRLIDVLTTEASAPSMAPDASRLAMEIDREPRALPVPKAPPRLVSSVPLTAVDDRSS